jgi:MFS family permease
MRIPGPVLLANAATVVVAQVPIARIAEGRCRLVLIAAAAMLFAAACLLVLTAHRGGALAYPALIAADIAVGLGECLHTTALMPLVADLAPASLRGRYMAWIGFSWWIELALGPTLGTQLLSAGPGLAFLAAAVVAAAAGVSALRLERTLPASARLTPRPGPRSASAELGRADVGMAGGRDHD